MSNHEMSVEEFNLRFGDNLKQLKQKFPVLFADLNAAKNMGPSVAVMTTQEKINGLVLELSNAIARAEKAEAEVARLNGVERELTLTLREANNENTELLKERDALRAEVERLNRPWTVSIIVPTKNDPFNRYSCEVVDVGHSDRHLVVECSQLRAQLAAAQEDKERLELLEVNAAEVRVEWDDGEGPIPPEFSIVAKGTGVIGRGPTLRAAIDAAREGTK